MKDHHGCPIQATSNVISGKWKVLILWHLTLEPHRFSELRALLPGVSEKVLTTQLRELEADGLVLRTSAHTMPPRVDYRLTHAGNQLIPIMEQRCEWAGLHLGVQPTLPPRPPRVPSSWVPAPAHIQQPRILTPTPAHDADISFRMNILQPVPSETKDLAPLVQS